MFALLETRIVPEKSLWKRPERAFHLSADSSLGISALWAAVDFPVEDHPRARLNRIQYALEQLHRRKVDRLVTPEGFGYLDQLPRYQMSAYSQGEVYRYLSPRLTGLALDRLGRSPRDLSAAIIARAVTPEVFETAQLLAGRARQLAVVTEDMRQVAALRRRLGAPVLENPPSGLLFSHSLFVIFEPIRDWSRLPVCRDSFLLFLDKAPEGAPPAGVTVCDGARLTPPARLEHPAGVAKLGLALALINAGVLTPHDLGVAGLTWRGKALP